MMLLDAGWQRTCCIDSVNIVADWPEDIKHFCDALIVGAGMRMDTPALSIQIVRIEAESALPHNALEDARGILRTYEEAAASKFTDRM